MTAGDPITRNLTARNLTARNLTAMSLNSWDLTKRDLAARSLAARELPVAHSEILMVKGGGKVADPDADHRFHFFRGRASDLTSISPFSV